MQQTIYVVRHGRTAHNAAARLLGTVDAPLDEVGEQQAKLFAGEVLRGVVVQVAWASPLLRAQQTAQLALEAAGSGVGFAVQPLVAERDFGPHEGKTAEELLKEFPHVQPVQGPTGRAVHLHLPHAETLDELYGRAVAARDGLLRLLPDGATAVVFSHGGFLRTLHAALMGVSVEYAFSTLAIGNCDVLVYTLRDGTVDDVRHHACTIV